MKAVIVALLSSRATSYIPKGIINADITRYTKLFLVDNEKELFEKLLQSKDQIIQIKDQIIQSKDELLESNEMLLAAANTKVLRLEGNLWLRSVIEVSERKWQTRFVSNSALIKGTTEREKLWNCVIDNNCSGINKYLSDTTVDWPSVAISLYEFAYDDKNKYNPYKVVMIMNTTGMSTEMLVLAEAICKVLPVKYEIVTPSPLDLLEENS